MTDFKDDIEKVLKDGDFMTKSDYGALLDGMKERTVGDVLNHTDCNNDTCDVCKFKKNIDGRGYERGIKSGIKLGQKFSKVHFTGLD